ncbi:MAG: FAD:protein transferase [Solirubrobacteraceae bacterium]|jgi:thiamine biosynthesis lipoprotein|nr:FAD:protein transferase [Solirubrobacteraceae bacterium]
MSARPVTAAPRPAGEARAAFSCFGATCAALVTGAGPVGSASAAVAMAREALLRWHDRFTRFAPGSELSALNADPRDAVPVSRLMGRLVEAVVAAGEHTGGLVDGTLLHELEDAGYHRDIPTPLPLTLALRLAPRRRVAGPNPRSPRSAVAYDAPAGVVRRPPGVGIDSGGLAKGLLADVLAERLGGHAAFAIDCAGDLRLGGAAAIVRQVEVQSPFHGGVLHAFELAAGGVATSGIGRRSWLDERGAPAHHLLDPLTGRPAFTGVVQASALAPTALQAEIRAKAAVLSGPDGAAAWLPDGGVVVLDDGTHRVVEAGDGG